MTQEQTGNRMNHKEFARTNKYFQDCCEVAKVPPTKRQASKFRTKRGTAYEIGKPLIDEKIEKGQIQPRKG